MPLLKEKTAEQRRDAALEQDMRKLVPIAKRLAKKIPTGASISVENVRLAAENEGLLFAYTDRAYLSRLFSLVMRRASLFRVKGEYVRTTRIGKRGGNLVSLWRRAA